MDHVPFISWERSIVVHIGKKAKREDKQPEINPCCEQHKVEESCDDGFLFNEAFRIKSTSCHEDVARIMDNQNEDSWNHLVTEEREEDERSSHKMMEHPFVVLMILSFKHH